MLKKIKLPVRNNVEYHYFVLPNPTAIRHLEVRNMKIHLIVIYVLKYVL